MIAEDQSIIQLYCTHSTYYKQIGNDPQDQEGANSVQKDCGPLHGL